MNASRYEMISKELLSEVLSDKVVDEVRVTDGQKVWFRKIDPKRMSIKWDDYVINIYELAHKCKEWAWDLGYEVSSKKDLEDRNCSNCSKYKHSEWDDFSYYCEEGIECPSNIRSLFSCNQHTHGNELKNVTRGVELDVNIKEYL